MAQVPRYTVNLDEPADTRWARVIEDYADKVVVVNDFIEETIKSGDSFMVKLGASVVETVMSFANQTKFVFYHDELKAIASGTKMPLGRVVMMQLVYEASALCTSIAVPAHVAQTTNPEGGVASSVSGEGTMAHIRTMDWEMEFLRSLTIEVEFIKDGNPLHTITTWAGYVGVLTGLAHRPALVDNFSISVNFRSKGSGSLWTNIKQAITRGWPIGFLVRETLEKASSYDQAVQWLRNSELIAPCYFTVASARPYTGCLITRDRTCDEHFASIIPPGQEPPTITTKSTKAQSKSKTGGGKTKGNGENEEEVMVAPEPVPFVVQTNIDHWSDCADEDIMDSIERRSRTQTTLLEQYSSRGSEGASATESPAEMDQEFLWKLLSRRPVCNGITIYGTLMYPSTGRLETRTPLPRTGFAVAAVKNNNSSSAKAERE